MTETKKQIKELKKALPGLKEKVFGVAVLLCISLVMVASVSYAWLTMSTHPELGGVNTTVSANGALEIALSDFDGEEPEQSAVGDSFAAQEQTTHAANTSWGNLVNISNGYGIESLVLRPAALDLQSDVKLYGAKYSEDGRVEGSLSDFGFTTWYQTDKNTNTWRFVAPSEYPTAYPNGQAYGVRAISSVAFTEDASVNVQKAQTLESLHRQAQNDYYTLTHNGAYIAVIQNLVQKYLDANIEAAFGALLGGDFVVNNFPMDGDDFVEPLTNMMQEFYNGAITSTGNALVYAANLQMEAFYNGPDAPEGKVQPEDYTLETLLAASSTDLKNNGINLSSLSAYKSLHNAVLADLTTMKEQFFEANGRPVDTAYWNDLEPIVNNLINVNKVKVEGKTIGDIAGLGMGALDFVGKMPTGDNGQPPASVVVYDGSLWDFEALVGEYMGMNIAVKVEMFNLYNGTAQMTTSVSRTQDSAVMKDRLATELIVGAVDNRQMVAQDTYGMMLDLWVRTNGENSLLTLNGTPKYQKREEQRVIIVDDQTYDVYAYNRYTGEKMIEMPVLGKVPATEPVEVYFGTYTDPATGQTTEAFLDCKTHTIVTRYDIENVTEVKDEEGKVIETTYTVVDSGEPVTLNDMNDYQNEKMVQLWKDVYHDVVGYESANRIWKEDDVDNDPPVLMPGEVSSTQGSGSCYIFYADSHEESARALELLANLRLVFLDENGRELSRASLDVENVYADSGKYTVPIIITQSSYAVTDPETGTVTSGICMLTKNEARRISVLVYLDGAQLKNEMVMSAEDIIGSLNLQFDSTADLRSIGDSELSMDVISLDADLLRNGSETVHEMSFEYDGNPVTVPVRATVDGLLPTKVEVAFQRKVSTTQGSRMDIVALNDDDGDGRWEANVTFKAPGTYILKTVLVDGIEYALPETLTVEIEGFAVSAVQFDTSAAMTTENSVSRDVNITLAADLKALPSKVQARFMTEDGRSINADLKKSPTGNTWSGTATFIKSGTYTLQYLVMDGEYYELPTSPTNNLQRSFTAYLGLTADVVLERYVTNEQGETVIGELTWDFLGAESVTAFVRIYDDTGTPMEPQGNVALTYKPAGSGILNNGFSTGTMTWNGEEYVGTFLATSPGVFEFGQLQMGGQTITSARKAPTITIISLTPPAFQRTESPEIILGRDKVYYQVYITDAQSAGRWVVLNDGATDHVIKLETTTTANVYQAELPDLDGNGNNGIHNSNGNWKVKELRFDNVYSDGKFIPSGDKNPYVINLESRNETFTVVNYLTVEANSKVFGANTDANGKVTAVTGQFMDSYNMQNQLTVTVKAPIKTSNPTETTAYVDPAKYASALTVTGKLTYGNDSNVSVTDANGNSISYGGYSGGTVNDVDITFTESAHDTKTITFGITEANNKVLRNAGTYDGAATVTLVGNSFGVAITDQVKIFSNKPTLKVTGVNPATSTTFKVNSHASAASGGGFTELSGVSNSFTDYNAVVYIQYTRATEVFGLAWRYYAEPSVTLTLSGMPTTFENASVTFNHPTATYAATYTFTPGNGLSQTKEIGHADDPSLTDGNPKLYYAGKQTVNQITVVVDGATYTVDLPHAVTINQPQYPPYADIKVDDSTFTGTISSRILGTPQADGTFVVTLPNAQTWYVAGERQVASGDYVNAGTKTHKGHVSYEEGCDTFYDLWSMVETRYEATSTKYTWTDTHQIVGWKVNGVQYAPGATVTISGGTTITAVVSIQEGEESAESSTAVYYAWDYTQDQEKAESNSGYSQDWGDGTDTTFSDKIGDTTNTTPFGGSW